MGRGELVSEADLQRAILDCAKLTGWLCYHTYDSRRSAPGFPDLVLCNILSQQANGVVTQELIFAELKSERGRVSSEQRVWITALRAAGQEVYIWRPRDLESAISRLSRPREESLRGAR
jgi:VRR-NUC domain